VADAFPDVGHKMLFLFDYGDDWRFTVEVIGAIGTSGIIAGCVAAEPAICS
jgi:hypothetical protein